MTCGIGAEGLRPLGMGEGCYYGRTGDAVNIKGAPLKDMRKGMKRYGNRYIST